MTTRQVIVIGAGPAGSTTASLLAARGVDVLVLEKDVFPREHIGESLLPASSIVQEVLGVSPCADTFVFKRGAQFICERSQKQAIFDFAEALPGPPRHAYHVDRARFDTLLRDRAAALGADVRHGVRVRSVEVRGSEVYLSTNYGEERCRFVVDATGQDRLLARLHKNVQPFGHFGKAASFTQFEGIGASALAAFAPHNDIRIMMLDEGWAWVIMLPGQRLSVGVVSRKQGARADDVLDYVQASPLLREWTRGTRAQRTQLIGNFSFRNRVSFGSRFACVGDSSCFIDPVFSSGVSLAVRSAEALVAELVPALSAGTEDDPNLAAPVMAHMEAGYDTFAALVYRFYNTRFAQNFLLGAPPSAALRASVVSVLAGDVFRPDNPFRDMLRASRIKPWREQLSVEPAPDEERHA